MQTQGFHSHATIRCFSFVTLALWAGFAWSVNDTAQQTGSHGLRAGSTAGEPGVAANRIQPYPDNPFYWQYKGEPVLLVGGSYQDNLFNHPHNPGLKPDGTLESHLDLLVSVGGNYVRNTMSHRDSGNVFPFKRLENGRFDLTQWNDQYWRRFDDFLRMTEKRGIIVQIEIWATYDYYSDRNPRFEPQSGWSRHPFNPQNNVNYTAQQSRLPTVWNEPPRAPELLTEGHPFFVTVPELDNNTVVMPYQQAFVDKILSYTFNYSHVLYTMNNEIVQPLPEWGEYWMSYVRGKAEEIGKDIETTDMIRIIELSNPVWGDHLFNQIDQPELYSFLEVSQNNRKQISTQYGWDQLMELREFLMDSPRPINNTKIYGGGGEAGGTVDEGMQKFWRNIMAGSASARFHRDADYKAGLGLNAQAQASLRSVGMLTNEMNIFSTEPRNDLLSNRATNEAYLLAEVGKQYALYFPDGGGVTLDLSDARGELKLKWLNISKSSWAREEILQGDGQVQINTPGRGHWTALILKNPSR